MQIEDMLTELPGEPSGINSEYSPQYIELEELALGTPENVMGDEVVPAVDPDWRKLHSNCLALWKTTRDLRVAAYYTVASLALDGLKGLRDGVRLIDWLVSDLWEPVWPRLDPDDDNDPTERVNIIQMLSPESGAFGDAIGFIPLLRSVRLADGFKWTLRDLLIANGVLDAAGVKVDAVLLNAEMTSVPVSRMAERLALVREISSGLEHIAGEVPLKTQNNGFISFATLKAELRHLDRFYSLHSQGDPSAAPPEETQAEPPAGSVFSASVPQAASRPSGSFINISEYHPATRTEALLLLKKAAEYFQNAEPTSPVPFLVNRALRMADMNFIELLAEIDENAVTRGREQLGVLKSEDGDDY